MPSHPTPFHALKWESETGRGRPGNTGKAKAPATRQREGWGRTIPPRPEKGHGSRPSSRPDTEAQPGPEAKRRATEAAEEAAELGTGTSREQQPEVGQKPRWRTQDKRQDREGGTEPETRKLDRNPDKEDGTEDKTGNPEGKPKQEGKAVR